MNKAEKTKLIAEKCMGWTYYRKNDKGILFFEVPPVKSLRIFNPYDNDADCMGVWDRFSEDHYVIMSNEPTDGNEWSIVAFDPRWDEEPVALSVNKDRRTAMCDCVVEAIK